MTKSRYVCVHGHYYQPPRENPWLESIEPQPSAAPFRDWNARILEECYRPNATARILDGENYITEIVNNYSLTSFNVGPTLMSWLELEAPDVYRAIVKADRLSQVRFGGHGSAMAQVYNHVIMPLANDRDKHTQVVWGMRDFEHRYGRKATGMWLAETAVDVATLEVLAEHEIEFTLLAPSQARRVRRIGDDKWHDVGGARVDPRQCYRANLPSGRTIDLFFYDGPGSRAVAFERLLGDGARFADRLLSLHGDGGGLAHIATDGETYGHHHSYGEMALAFACTTIERSNIAQLTNYGQFRELYPPEWEVEIVERTAWSCAHGVGRWHDDCGCHSGGRPDWHQRWRAPLRAALDWLRDDLANLFERATADLLADPWAARNDYINLVLDRSRDNVARFLRHHAGRDLDATETRQALQLLEIQRNAMLMYTSCGWFFDDISGTEGVQVLRYAARAIELASFFGRHLEDEFVDRLAQADSNVPHVGNGRGVWTQLVKPSQASLRDVVAHQAVMSLFASEQDECDLYAYELRTVEFHRATAGMATLIAGTTHVSSKLTRAEATFCFAALHLGDHNIMGGVLTSPDAETYERLLADVFQPFERADLVATQRQLDRHFGDASFSLRSLFSDQRDRVLDKILQRPIEDAETAFRRLHEQHGPLMLYLGSLSLPQPEVLRTAAQLVLNVRLRRELEREQPDTSTLRAGFQRARSQGIELDIPTLAYAWQRALERGSDRVAVDSENASELDHVGELASLARALELDVHPRKLQNTCWELTRTLLAAKTKLAQSGHAGARKWLESFASLCDAVQIRVATG